MVHSIYKFIFIQASHILFKEFYAYNLNGASIKVEVANVCAAMEHLDSPTPHPPPPPPPKKMEAANFCAAMDTLIDSRRGGWYFCPKSYSNQKYVLCYAIAIVIFLALFCSDGRHVTCIIAHHAEFSQ